jgi:hypothetical protein
MAEVGSRIWGVDYARSFAVILALFSHCMLTFEFNDLISKQFFLFNIITRSATPMFVFMFGFMLCFIYSRSTDEDINVRLYKRSIQCYSAYFITALSGFLGGYKTLIALLASFVFFAQSHYGNILRVYVVILIFSPFLIGFYKRKGRAGLIFMLSIFLLYLGFKDYIPYVEMGIFSNIINVFFGVWGFGGPSIMGAMVFLIMGMISADLILKVGVKGVGYLLCFWSLFSFVFLFYICPDSVGEIILNYANYTYRGGNRIEYFLIGSFSAILFFYSFVCLERFLPKNDSMVIVGRSSLISYTFGNILLNTMGWLSLYLGVFYFILLYFTLVYAFSRWWSILPLAKLVERFLSFNWIVNYLERARR